jgi:hypothetical protein
MYIELLHFFGSNEQGVRASVLRAGGFGAITLAFLLCRPPPGEKSVSRRFFDCMKD